MRKRKRKNYFALILGLSFIMAALLGTLLTETVFATANSNDNGDGGNSAKTFSIQNSGNYTKKADLTKLVVSVDQGFPIYIYAVNEGNAQAPEVAQDIPLQLTLYNPSNDQTFQTNIIIPKGPANTYATLNLSCAYPGEWTVQVVGNLGKDRVSVTDTFTVVGNQASLNIIPPEATILLGSTQQFEALFTNSQGTTTPISDDSEVGSLPDALNYALFSGSSTSTLALNGTNLSINGSTHSNKDFTASVYKLNITGTCEAVTTVQLNGNPSDIQIGKIVQNAPSIDMPDIGSSIIAMAQATGQTYNGNKTYNDTNVSFNSPIYVNGDLTINCNQFSGIGPIVATGNITINSTTLSVTNDAPVCLYSKNGNITIGNSSVNLKGMVYAPNGTITMNGSYLTISGRVIGKEVAISPNQLTIDSSSNDLTSLLSSGATPVKWSSSNTSVASISSNGLATSKGVGTCTITATYKDSGVSISATATLTVVDLSITPANKIISLGSTQQYQAEFTDSTGKVTDVTPLINQWSSISLGWVVSTINANGLVTANREGSSTISATYMVNGVGITATTSLIVVKPTLSITSISTTMLVGSTQQYQATLTDYEGHTTDVTQAVTWSSDKTSVATIDSTGLATGSGVGTCTITGTYVINGVSLTATTPLAIVNLNITPTTATILLDSTQQYQAKFTDSTGYTSDVTKSVTWSSSSTGVATLDSSGLATANGAGTSTISATYVVNGVNLTVQTQLTVVNLSITPTNKIISLGSTQQYQAEFTDSTGKVTDVTPLINQWSSISLGWVVSTINANGLATANREGTSTISATYMVNGVGITAMTSLIVVNPTLSITSTSSTILLGSTQQYQATLTDYEGHTTDVTQAVTWSSDKTSVATIDSTGLATGSGVGTCTITGTYVINGVSITATTPLAIVNLSITPTTTTISLGSTQQYQADFTDSTGNVTDVTKSQSVTWSSGSIGVATISSIGLATPKGVGTSIISATYMVNGVSLTASASLIIVKPILSITPATTTILPGSKQQYQAILTDSAGNMKEVTQFVTWSSNQPSTATIDSLLGLATGKSAGTCIISGTYIINGVSITSTATLTIVNLNMVEALIVTPVPMTDAIFVGYTQQFSAQLKYSDGSTSDVTNLVTWTSSVNPVATIGNTGLVTGISAGTSIISATLTINTPPLTGSYLLTVLPHSGGIIREWEQ